MWYAIAGLVGLFFLLFIFGDALFRGITVCTCEDADNCTCGGATGRRE